MSLYQHKAVTRSPDIRRSELSRREMRPIPRHLLPADIPWVKIPDPDDSRRKIDIPAVVEIRAIMRDQVPAENDPYTIWSSWNVWVGPRDPSLLYKLVSKHRAGKSILDTVLNPLHEQLGKLGAEKGATYAVHYCPARRNNDLTPFYAFSFKAMSEQRRLERNQALLTWGWRFARFMHITSDFPENYLVDDPWSKAHDGVHRRVKDALAEEVGECAGRLWNTWVQHDHELGYQLVAQGVNAGAMMPTQLGVLRATQMDDPSLNRTLYFQDGVPLE